MKKILLPLLFLIPLFTFFTTPKAYAAHGTCACTTTSGGSCRLDYDISKCDDGYYPYGCTSTYCQCECSPYNLGEVAKVSDFTTVFERVIGVILGFAGLALFILLIAGGFRYITSGGDPKAVEAAQKTLTSAILGLIIILVSYIILLLISRITGVDLTNFNITVPFP